MVQLKKEKIAMVKIVNSLMIDLGLFPILIKRPLNRKRSLLWKD